MSLVLVPLHRFSIEASVEFCFQLYCLNFPFISNNQIPTSASRSASSFTLNVILGNYTDDVITIMNVGKLRLFISYVRNTISTSLCTIPIPNRTKRYFSFTSPSTKHAESLTLKISCIHSSVTFFRRLHTFGP